MTLEEYETLVEAQRLELVRLNGVCIELQEKLDQEIGANAALLEENIKAEKEIFRLKNS